MFAFVSVYVWPFASITRHRRFWSTETDLHANLISKYFGQIENLIGVKDSLSLTVAYGEYSSQYFSTLATLLESSHQYLTLGATDVVS